MCSLNCIHALHPRLVVYSPCLSYYSQILALKAAKDSFIQFSSTVLYFNNLAAEEDVFFVFFCFVKTGRATKIRIKQNLFLFDKLFQYFKLIITFTFQHFYLFFCSTVLYEAHAKKYIYILQTHRCSIYML